MSTTKIVCLALMIVGLVVCYFLFGIGVPLWFALAFILAYGVIFGGLVAGKTNTSLLSLAPIALIVFWIGGAVLFFFIFGWKQALAYLILGFLFGFVQPNAR